MRRLITLIAVLAAAPLLAPAPVQADHRTVTVTTTGEITLWDCFRAPDANIPCSDPPEARHLWAPFSPACESTPCPGPRLSSGQVDWVLGSGEAGSEPDDGVECVIAGSVGPCHVTAYGTLASSNFLMPLWCGGPALGQIRAFVDVGDETIVLGGPWIFTHVGPQLVWRLFQSGGPDGAGVGTMTLTNPQGGCGLNPADEFAPAHSFTVSLSLDWHATV